MIEILCYNLISIKYDVLNGMIFFIQELETDSNKVLIFFL